MDNNSRSDEDEERESFPFDGLDKASAVQECRIFNKIPLDEEGSIRAMTQILYLLSIGVRLTEKEATDIFFMSTKLMQSTYAKLRRLQYILMKELSPLVEQSFIASNALMTDIKKKGDADKSCAIRTLYAVMDSSMYSSMDRTIVECMTSRNPDVVTAALVTGIHMSNVDPDTPRKWGAQLNEVLRDRSKAQYPAIALLHTIRNNDRISADRLIEDTQNGRVRSPFAVCLVVKMCAELMRRDFTGSVDIYKFVVSMMQRGDMVVFEAAEAIASLRNITDRELTPVITALRPYLASSDEVQRFAAIHLISRISATHPGAVTLISADLEPLTQDNNRDFAAMAISSLLKAGAEETISHMLVQLTSSNAMREFGDELKMSIVDSTRMLSLKFPHKSEILLAFLFRVFADESSSALKQNVLDVMLDIAKTSPATNEAVLGNLAELIDDCEFSQITKGVLAYLAEGVPQCSNPSRFVRYIYNHAILEKPDVRAVAVTTLAKIAASVPSLRRSIVALLKYICKDSDDEVRDRALLYTRLFLHNDESLVKTYVKDIATAASEFRNERRGSRVKVKVTEGGAGAATSNDVAAVVGVAPHGAATLGMPAATPAILQGREALRHLQQLRELGEPLKSTDPLLLTEGDSDYVVSVMKHMYPANLVLQFKVKNNVRNELFRDVVVVTNTDELEVEPLYAIPASRIPPEDSQYCYAVLRYAPGQFPSGTVETVFRFTIVEDDTTDTKDTLEYTMEDFDVDINDFICPVNLGDSMEKKWVEMGDEETAGTFALQSMKNLTEAANQLAEFFGMYVEGGVPEKITTTSHVLRMAGVLTDANHTLILVQAKVFISTDSSVALSLVLRGGSAEIRKYLADALLG